MSSDCKDSKGSAAITAFKQCVSGVPLGPAITKKAGELKAKGMDSCSLELNKFMKSNEHDKKDDKAQFI
ncbi:unnamed protein product [Medioppia subpectinata]|uniref:Uncharacterized protein n=1 Tax=Medioppia subpectinata TaxID=1979941 RepID=A0A7R9KVJ3_9ACAR|nr:unnamed protein product [Medioppia subpectinata]CAG2109284.1 unnamed protein product [Medioppia subpectinata]